MKCALITGSAGFIGRNFRQHLQSAGWNVIGCDLIDDHDALDLFRREDVPRLDLVVHAAYYVGGRAAIDGINDYLAANLQLDAAMFRWALRTRQRRVVYLSSSAAYPTYLQGYPFFNCRDIDTRLVESDIDLEAMEHADAYYGLAKLTGEHLAQMARANGLQVSVVRPFSGYGEDQSLDYPMPAITSRAIAGDYTVWGPRGQTRDWIHASDVIGAIMNIVESGTADPVNLCTGVGTEMGDLMTMIVKQVYERKGVSFDAESVKVFYDTSRPTGVFSRVGNPDRMMTFYSPKVTLDQGISMMLDRFFL